MREMEDLNHEDHEGHEETNSTLSPRHQMQLPSPLTAEAEMGCAADCWSTFGWPFFGMGFAG